MKTSIQSIAKGNSFKPINSGHFLLRTFLITVIMTFLVTGMVMAQIQSLELGEDSEPDPNTGPTTTIEIPLLHNINNPDDDDFTPYFPNTTVTISFSEFAYNSPDEQDTGPDQPNIVIGWLFNPEGPDFDEDDPFDGMSDGADEDRLVPFTVLDESLDFEENLYESIDDLENFYSSVEGLATGDPDFEGDGFSFTENRGAFISASFAGLGESTEFDTDTPYESGARYRIATMTIEFNRPVNNPILHFFGLGSFWEYTIVGDNLFYINAASAEFDLWNSNLGTEGNPGVNMEVLSSNPRNVDDTDANMTNPGRETGLYVEGNSIINSWNYPDVIDTDFSDGDDAGTANGSIIVRGEGIQTLTFRVYARAINNIDAYRAALAADPDFPILPEDGFFYGSEALGWSGDAQDTEAQDNVDDIDDPIEIPPYNFASDAFILSVSAEVEPDEEELTLQPCYRMLSSPVAGATYNNIIGDFWTQGVANSNYEPGDPNIFIWPAGDDDISGGLVEDWLPLPGTDELTGGVNATITSGRGFLMSVFTDDEYGTEGSWDKPFSVTGSEPPSPVQLTTTHLNTGEGEWNLFGNPFKAPISFANFYSDNQTTGIDDAVYVFFNSRVPSSGDLDEGIGEDNGEYKFSGGWVSTAAGFGELEGGMIFPFQGFFVENDSELTDLPIEFNR